MTTDASTIDRAESGPRDRLHVAPEPPPHSVEVLDLIVDRAWLCVRRRTAWLESLGIGVESTPRPPLSADPDDLAAELEWRQASAAGREWNAAIAAIERRLAGQPGVHLQHLTETFGLTDADRDLLQICVAAHLDPSLGPAFAHVSGHPARAFVTDALARQLLGYGRRPIWQPVGPLAVWKLVHAGPATPGEPEPLAADPAVVGWLCGQLTAGEKLAAIVHHVRPLEPLDDWPVDQLALALQRNQVKEARLRFVIEGPPGSGRSTFAATAAAQLGSDCFRVDTSEVSDDDWPALFTQAQRLAVIGGLGLIWRGENLQHRRWQAGLTSVPTQVVVCEPGQSLPPCGDWIDYRIRLPEPSVAERRRLWRAAVPSSNTWSEPELQSLAERFALTPGEIAAVGGRAVATASEAAELARETARHRLGDLGKTLDCPFSWDDIVLPEPLLQGLQDFAFEARERVRFWENPDARRLFPRGTGLTALLNGPSGTGKTMATQVIAAELGLDLIRIDMARVVSKYIGETAKHLSEVFTRAARMSAVLLFDEADALFARRTEVKDAHDRHANTDTSYLLQLLEEFRGVAFLTTNKKGNIDPAFIRRIRYVFDFPAPEARERRRIWGKVVRALANPETEAPLAPTLDQLAGSTPVSGAQIKNAVLAAVFIARRRGEPLSGRHLLAGLHRELGKEGRSVSPRGRARVENEH